MQAAYRSGQLASSSPVRFSCSPCAPEGRRVAAARSDSGVYEVGPGSIRPGSRVVTSWSSHVLPSGSVRGARVR